MNSIPHSKPPLGALFDYRKQFQVPLKWKGFRQTYRTWLDSTGAPVAMQRELMRQASIEANYEWLAVAMRHKRRIATHSDKRIHQRFGGACSKDEADGSFGWEAHSSGSTWPTGRSPMCEWRGNACDVWVGKTAVSHSSWPDARPMTNVGDSYVAVSACVGHFAEQLRIGPIGGLERPLFLKMETIRACRRRAVLSQNPDHCRAVLLQAPRGPLTRARFPRAP
jgi:hypothetical protein